MYGNLDNNSILSSMADIFNRFDNNLSSKEELITEDKVLFPKVDECKSDSAYGFKRLANFLLSLMRL